MRIVVIGAGVAGLASSLYLARDGHDVILLERDATPLPESADAAFEWDRRGATQVRHPHAFLAPAAEPAAGRPARRAGGPHRGGGA